MAGSGRRHGSGRAAARLTAVVAVVLAGVGDGAGQGLAALRQPPGVPGQPGQSVPASSYSWPLWPQRAVLRPFQPPAHPYGAGHRGVDLAGGAGQDVLAAGDGVVAFAAPLAGRGVISVQHADGLRTTYEPVTAAVQAGSVVRRGQLLGRLEPGHPRCAPAPCLHWGVRRGAEYLDPLRLVWGGRVRLLPWNGGVPGSGGFE